MRPILHHALLLAVLPALAFAHDGPHECGTADAAILGDALTIPVEVPTLLYFGFTTCPDVCPLDLSRNAEAVEAARAHGVEARNLFVSVDGADGPEDVEAYALGWPGTEGRVADPALEAALRVVASPREGAPELIDHSTLTYVAAPGVGVVALAARAWEPARVTDLLICLGPTEP